MSGSVGESFTNSGRCVTRARARDDLAQRRRVRAELDAARLHVRAAHVELERRAPAHRRRRARSITRGELLDWKPTTFTIIARARQRSREPRQVLVAHRCDARDSRARRR